MAKNVVAIIKASGFFIGVIFYVLFFLLVTGGHPSNNITSTTTHDELYLWVVIMISYCAFFMPLAFDIFSYKSIAKQIWLQVILFLLDCTFCIASLVTAVLVCNNKLDKAISLMMQGVIVFVNLVFILIGTILKGKDDSPRKKEKLLKSNVMVLRENFDKLARRVQMVDAIKSDTKNQIIQMAEDTRYMATVENATAIDLESRIQDLIDEVNDNCTSIEQGLSCTTLDSLVNSMDSLVNERKMCQ